MSHRPEIRSFVVYVWILLSSVVALGQVTSRVTGVVRDPSGVSSTRQPSL